MKSTIILIVSMSLIGITSCHTKHASAATTREVTLTGTFQSKRGVMDPLSCFCYNSGYITTSSGEEIAICLPETTVVPSCKTLTIRGEYITEKQEKDPKGVCPGGTMTYLKARSVQCE